MGSSSSAANNNNGGHRPSATGGGTSMTLAGMGRNNTDLFFPSRQHHLKYERFDPPPLAGSVPRNPFASPPSSNPHRKLSPASAAMVGAPPKPLDLDLMSDLREVIFPPQQQHEVTQQQPQQKDGRPPVNRHVRQLSFTFFCMFLGL